MAGQVPILREVSGVENPVLKQLPNIGSSSQHFSVRSGVLGLRMRSRRICRSFWKGFLRLTRQEYGQYPFHGFQECPVARLLAVQLRRSPTPECCGPPSCPRSAHGRRPRTRNMLAETCLRKHACVGRESASTEPHALQVWEVYAAGTGISSTALYSSACCIDAQPVFRITRFTPALALTFVPGVSHMPLAN